MTTPQTIIAALAVVGVRCSQEMAERVLHEHVVREAIIETVIGSQAMSGVTISRATAERAYDRAYAKPLIEL